MPKQKRRVPREDGAFNEWYRTFSTNLGDVAETVEVSSTKVERAQNDSAAFDYLQTRKNLISAFKEADSAARKSASDNEPSTTAVKLPVLTLPAIPAGVVINHGIKKWANNLVQQICDNENCTLEIENFLGIELKGGDAPETVSGDIKSAAAGNGGAITLKCLMQGYKGYSIFSMRGDETDFVKIGDSIQSEYTDERPNLKPGQPEKRQYKIIMMEKNKPVGDYSDVKVVVTKP